MSNSANVIGEEQKTAETLVLPIRGMTCAACQAHVERSLKAAPGVIDASVNLLAQSARVIYQPGESSPSALAQVVDDAGYEAVLASAASSTNPPSTETDASTNQTEARSEHRLLLISAATIAAAVLAMFSSMPLMRGMMPGVTHLSSTTLALWLGAVTLAAMLTAGAPVYTRAWNAARHGTTNMHTLVALGTLAAFGYSAAATLQPSYFAQRHIAADLYYDSVL